MNGYSDFFSFNELTDSSSHPELVAQNRIDAIKFQNAGKRLSKLLESVRHILGDKPLKISSGFRNERLNSAVGSKAKSSAHLRFEAADVIPNGMTIQEAFTALIMAYRGRLLPDLRKVLHEGTWLHIEVNMKVEDHIGFFISKDNNKTWIKVA